MNNSHALMIYSAILATTGKMLSAAQNNEWDRLIELEIECRKLTDSLIKDDSVPILDKDILQKKVQIIHQILADDAQIKALTEPWMITLQDMLYSNNQARNLQYAYQSINNG